MTVSGAVYGNSFIVSCRAARMTNTTQRRAGSHKNQMPVKNVYYHIGTTFVTTGKLIMLPVVIFVTTGKLITGKLIILVLTFF